MNRNMMYEYLKSLGMYGIFHRHKYGYHTEFRLNQEENQYDATIKTDWGYIRHIYSIHLCANEIVIEAHFSDMKINMFYKDINTFEVSIMEE